MNDKLRTNKAFTLIELVVAIGVLALVLAFAGAIFKVSVNSYRTALANAEIMRKLRAITNQLDADFRGLRTDTPGKIDFGQPDSGQPDSDRIVFFANGDFQSTSQYDGKTVVGNVASIFYGLVDPNSYVGLELKPKDKILARRQTILTADSDPDLLPASHPLGEYYYHSLSEWGAEWRADPNVGDVLMKRPLLELSDLGGDGQGLATYMAKGVDNFTIEYEQGYTSGLESRINWSREQKDFSTRAFKFTFTLYDSKGIIKNGRTFTHIVYLGG